MVKINCFFILYFLVIFSGLPAQIPQNYQQDQWFTEQGLPQNSVYAIAQSNEGYLWLATEAGLARFDGVSFIRYYSGNTKAFQNDVIQNFWLDQENTLWIASHNGLISYCQREFKRYSKSNGLSSNIIRTIAQSSDGTLWVGCRNGLNQQKGDRFFEFPLTGKNLMPEISTIAADSENGIWVGTIHQGLYYIKRAENQFRIKHHSFSEESISAIYLDNSNRIWIGIREKGLIAAELTNQQIKVFDKPIENSYITGILQDNQGVLWVGCRDNGLFALQVMGNIISKKHINLLNNSVLSLFYDREGIIWIGTNCGGLISLKQNKIKSLTKQNGLMDDVIFPVFESRQGAVWIGTEKGLNCLKDDQITAYSKNDGLTGYSFSGITEDASGRLFVLTNNGIIHVLDRQQFIKFSDQSGESLPLISSMHGDKFGNIWLSGLNGTIFKIVENRIQKVLEPGTKISVIFPDSMGTLWLGSLGQGLFGYSNGSCKRYTQTEGLADPFISYIAESATRQLMVVSYTGLHFMKNNTLIAITRQNGFPEATLYCALEDENRNVWISSSRGIVFLKSKEIDLFLAGKTQIVSPDLYGREEGMVSIECNGLCYPPGFKAKNNQLWFPTTRGVAIIDTEEMVKNTWPPTVFIDRVIINNQPYPADISAVVPPGKGNLEFDITAVNFTSPNKIQFQHQLKGFDSEWQQSKPSRNIVYTNIPSGFYQFEVRAMNSDGVWNKDNAVFRFQLKPFFYQTGWFYSIIAFLVISLALVLHFLRVRQLLLKERKKYESSFLTSDHADNYMKKLKEFMNQEKPFLSNEFSLENLAEQMHIPRHYLSQVINWKCGQNYFDFINSYRITEAKQLLSDAKDKKIKVMDIAFQVGFNSLSSFNAAFKKHAGVTPTQFRKKKDD